MPQAVVGALITAVVSTVLSVGLSFASRVIGGNLNRRKTPSFDSGRSPAIIDNVKQPITARTLCYGVVRVGGPFLYLANSANAIYLYLLIAHAGNKCKSMQQYLMNELPISFRSDGFSENRYYTRVHVDFHDGDDNQDADAFYVSDIPAWTAAHRLRGICYTATRLTFDTNSFAAGVPVISVIIHGAADLYDPRTSTYGFSRNPALCIRDYLTRDQRRGGMGVATADIDDDYIIAAANVCDELVEVEQATDEFTADVSKNLLSRITRNCRWMCGDVVRLTGADLPVPLVADTDYYVIPVWIMPDSDGTTTFRLASSLANALSGTALTISDAGTGTHTVTRIKEQRYTCDGVVELSKQPRDILESLLSSCAGTLANVGGRWRLIAGAWQPPTIDIDEDDLRGPLQVQTILPLRETVNAIKGVFIDPYASFQPTDAPPLESDAYLAEDNGERRYKDVELKFTASPSMAQRLFKIDLLASRKQTVVQAACKLRMLRAVAGENVTMSNARFTWAAEPFRVTEWTLLTDGAAVGVNLTLRSTEAAVYDWSTDDEKPLLPGPDTDFPDPQAAPPQPASISLTTTTSTLGTAPDVVEVNHIVATWSEPQSAFVAQGGYAEVAYRKTGETSFLPSAPADELTRALIGPVTLGDLYDVRVRFVSRFRVPSAWTMVSAYEVGGTSGVASAADWGLWGGVVASSDDWGSYGGAPATTDDWGSWGT